MSKWDFEGWATKNDLKCSDNRIIRHGAFAVNNGKKVPMVWNHRHDTPSVVLGHAMLENRDEGVYAKCSFNATAAGKDAKEAVKHGDVVSLSIWANNLQQVGNEVIHGVIREVSLVLAGANPGACIESVMAHGEPMEDGDFEGIFFTGEGITLAHADSTQNSNEDDIIISHADEEEDTKSKNNKTNDEEETVKDVFETLSDKQKQAVAIIVGQAIQDSKSEKEDNEMKHNIFSDGVQPVQYLSHSDMKQIFKDGKSLGSLKESVERHLQEGGILAHALDTTGMTTHTGSQNYGINDVDMLFPEFKSLNTPPEFISREMSWVQKVMNGVHRTPFSRIKSVYANITEDEARAKGYIKGKQKKDEVFTTLKRTTSPQTIYKKQRMDRDDIIDITDFDVVAWIKAEMRVMLDEEIARAILIGDGRMSSSDDKIREDNVRPIATDVPLFNVQTAVTVPTNADPAVIAKTTINEIIRARKYYKGSANPTFFTTEDVLTEMLLLEDAMGHKMYKTEAEIATTLRVSEIVTVEVMEGQTIDIGGDSDLPLIGIIVNLQDYNVGADKGGAVSMFEDFDLDFNQEKYLIETRISGALIKPFSALTFALKKSS